MQTGSYALFTVVLGFVGANLRKSKLSNVNRIFLALAYLIMLGFIAQEDAKLAKQFALLTMVSALLLNAKPVIEKAKSLS